MKYVWKARRKTDDLLDIMQQDANGYCIDLRTAFGC